ncbi:MAG: hypothetical protein IPL06_09945 [Betaproteobacteria bacterium]|nr:hypothetical protein [Betaproteobacteria bacterium]
MIVQLPPAAIVPPVRLIPTSPTPSAPAPVSVSVPPQVFVFVPLASVIGPGETGNTSVKARPVSAVALGLVTVTASVVVPPEAIVAAPKALATVGRASTSRFALAAPALLPPLAVVTLPAARVFV